MKKRRFLAGSAALLAVMCLGLWIKFGGDEESQPRGGGQESQPTGVQALLADRLKWKKASQKQIEQVAKTVLGQIGSGYKYLETKRFSCGGEEHFIPIFEHEKTGLKLNLVPGGTYQRSVFSKGFFGFFRKPVKEVVRVPAFLVGQTEVTQVAWDKVGGRDKRKWRGPKLPIEGCSWNDCEKWLRKAGDGLRMLSEAQWEYACRAGTRTEYSFGDDSEDLWEYAWFRDNSGMKPHPVGEKLPNAFGLYDVHGNVYEWCADWSEALVDGMPASLPYARSGCWKFESEYGVCSSAHSMPFMPRGLNITGLRVARDLN